MINLHMDNICVNGRIRHGKYKPHARQMNCWKVSWESVTSNLVPITSSSFPYNLTNSRNLSVAAQTLIDLGKDKKNVDEYACAVDEMLGDFEFPDEFLYDVWGALTDARPKSS